MPYVVEQKIKGNIYLYLVESYWDTEKKQSRQKRTYIGPKTTTISTKSLPQQEILYKKYGNVFLLHTLSHQLGLDLILKEVFQDEVKEILALAFFHITDENALYMFPHWLHEHEMMASRRLHSTTISSFCERLGACQKRRQHFFEKWIQHCHPTTEIYYDTTSMSSYASTIDFIEWGYNRDHDKLPQIHLGMACQKNGLPLFYQLYPGSISDVQTLQNTLTLLDSYQFNQITFVIDRGFCSQRNIEALQQFSPKIRFIQPMTFSLKSVTQLVRTNRKRLQQLDTAFKYGQEVLHYVKDQLNIGGVDYDAHIYFNENVHSDVRHNVLAKILTYTDLLRTKTYSTLKEFHGEKSKQVPEKYRACFKRSTKTGSVELHQANIQKIFFKTGYFIVLSNSPDEEKICLLDHYRQRDIIEKLFDYKKNALQGRRLRSHSQTTSDGRVFIKFIALILYSSLIHVMKEQQLLERYSVKELLAELSKIRCAQLGDETVISEISKTQRKILSAFNITPEMLHTHRY